MVKKTSTTTDDILSLAKVQINKLGLTSNLVSTNNAVITDKGVISIGLNPPSNYGNNEGIFMGYDNGPQLSLYSNENNFLKWDGNKLLIQAENFILDSQGNITANNAFLAGSIVAQSGSIAGWIIRDDVFYTGSGSTTVGLDSGGINPAFYAGASASSSSSAPFRVYNDGRLYASNANISGSITATSGCFGGWSLSASSLHAGANNTYVALDSGGVNPSVSAGGSVVGDAPFRVYNDGRLYASNANITGSITATSGCFGGWSLSASALNAGSGSTTVGLDSGGINPAFYAGASASSSSSAPFRVYNDGRLYATNANITGSIIAASGSIGAWKIDSGSIVDSSGTVGLSNSVTAGDDIRFWAGNIDKTIAPFYVTESGFVRATSASISGSITALGGYIGGNKLSASSISSLDYIEGNLGKGWAIYSNGTAEFQNILARGMIRTAVFQKDTISAVNGMVMISKSDILAADMGSEDDDDILIVSGSGAAFVIDEVLRLKDGTDDEWLKVYDAQFPPIYAVNRDISGNYGSGVKPKWKTGTTVVSMGVGDGTKTGFLMMDASSANSPFIDIYGRNSTTYNDYTLHGRFGYLGGITDPDVGLSSTDIWGIYTDNAFIKGAIVASSGSIGAWKITNGSIVDVTGVVGLSNSVTAGDDIRIWAGNSTPLNAPFYVTESGLLKATSASITGSIVANSGYIGGANGWTITDRTIYGGNVTGSYTGMIQGSGSIKAFFAGANNTSGGSALFYVTAEGNLYAQSAELTGAIYATSGCIVGQLNMLGEQSSIAIGATPPTSSASGTGIWIDRGGIYGLSNDIQQVILDSTNGKITAAGGLMYIDAEGITGDTLLKWMIRQSAAFGTPSRNRTAQLGMEEYGGTPSFAIAYYDSDFNGTSTLVNGGAESGDLTAWTPSGTGGSWLASASYVNTGNYAFAFLTSGSSYASRSILNFNGSASSTTFTDDGILGLGSGSWSAYGAAKLNTSIKKYGTASLAINGDTDFIATTALSSGVDSYQNTRDFWIYFTEFPVSGRVGGVFGQNNGTGNELYNCHIASNGTLTYSNKDTTGAESLLTADGLLINTWYHIAIIHISYSYLDYDGGMPTQKYVKSLKLYVDGVLKDSDNYLGTSSSPYFKPVYTGSFCIGTAYQDGVAVTAGSYKGYIDSFVIRASTGSAVDPYRTAEPIGYVTGTLTSDNVNVVDDTDYVISSYIKQYVTTSDANPTNAIWIDWYDSASALLSRELVGEKYTYDTSFENIQKIVTSPAKATAAKIVLESKYFPVVKSGTPAPHWDDVSVVLKTNNYVYQKLLFTDVGLNTTFGLYPTTVAVMGDDGVCKYSASGIAVPMDRNVESTQSYGFWARPYITPTAAGYEYYYYPMLEAGIYTLRFLHRKYTSGGIFDIYFDDVLITKNYSVYETALVNEQDKGFHGIIAPYSGRHTLKLVSVNKNGSSGGYLPYVTKFTFTKDYDYFYGATQQTFSGSTCSDTYIRSAAATTNYGTAAVVYSGSASTGGGLYRTLMKWDAISDGGIPTSASILSATLKLTVNAEAATSERDFYVWPVLQDWNVSQATWNIYKTGSNWGSAGADLVGTDVEANPTIFERIQPNEDPGYAQVHWDITSLAKRWHSGALANYGMLITGTNTWAESNDRYAFESTETTTGSPPMLEVVYRT